MFIKCPRCSIGYNVPDNRIGDKPRKMRCTRCKNVFAVARRSGSPPPGYEEFTGRHSALPREFAFLRESPSKKTPPIPPVVIESNIPRRPSQEPTMLGVYQPGKDAAAQAVRPPEPEAEPVPLVTVAREPTPPQPSPPVEPPPSGPPATEQPVVDKNALVEEVLRQAKERKAAATPDTGTPQAAPKAVAQPPVVAAAQSSDLPTDLPTDSTPVVAATPPQPSPSQDQVVPDIYGGSASAWETEAPLDLGGFAVESPSSTGQLVGKLATAFVVLVASFFVYVAYRNGWSLSLPELDQQIAFAFSEEETERLPDEVDGLEVTIDERRVLLRKRKPPLLIINGKVFNNTSLPLTNIVLRGRVFDEKGEMRAQIRIPCDRLFRDKKLKKARSGAIPTFYRKKGALHNCTIKGESSTLYQIVFEDPPADYDETFRVEVKPISARNPG